MERAVREVAALIEHLRLESLGKQIRCFYCAGLHRTADCASPKREDFMMNLAGMMAGAKEDLEEPQTMEE
jgi:hypothetical protein